MADLLVRDIDPALKRRIEENARKNRHSISEEAKALLRQALAAGGRERRKLGTAMIDLVPAQYRGDDLVFEVDEPVRKPPDLS
jgi:plasmid stability protein